MWKIAISVCHEIESKMLDNTEFYLEVMSCYYKFTEIYENDNKPDFVKVTLMNLKRTLTIAKEADEKKENLNENHRA